MDERMEIQIAIGNCQPLQWTSRGQSGQVQTARAESMHRNRARQPNAKQWQGKLDFGWHWLSALLGTLLSWLFKLGTQVRI